MNDPYPLELPLVFVGGLLGSYHCIGMCGPLALALGGGSGSARNNLQRQVVFSLGRLFTYGFGGAVAGYGGYWLSRQPVLLANVQAWLAIAAGALLILIGLTTAGLAPNWMTARLAHVPCMSFSWLKTFLSAPGPASILLAGVFTGFIPCGLVYGFLALAASTGDPLKGWATMALFGLGTFPLMILTGCGSSLITGTTRGKIFRLAAISVFLTGVISVARGAWLLNLGSDAAQGSCPLCP